MKQAVSLRIQPGAGGEEARAWAERLGRMYVRHAERHS